MPPNSTLLKIYDKITIGKCSYCFLCFRTDSESKLKIPQSYLKSTTSLSTLGNISNKPPRICYMCETLALAAAKFRKATFFATSIDMLFKSMMLSSKYQTEVRKLLDKDGPIDPVDFDKHRSLFIDEQELTAYRKTMQLQRTEVVVIDSNDVFTNDPNTTIKTLGDSYKVAQPPQLNLTIDISEDTNSCEMNLQTTATKPTEDIIILDDDQPKHTQTRIRSNEQIPNQIMYKKAKIKEKTHQEMKDRPTLVPIEKLMQKQEATVGFLHAILQNPDGTKVVPTLSAQIVNGQLIFQNQETPQPLVYNTIIMPSKVTEEPPKNSAEEDLETDKAIMDVQAVVDKIVVDRLEDIKRQRLGLKGQQLAQVVVDTDNKVVKEPLMKTDRIDWEDKIPMDVISFMDATDPNPPSYIKPLLPPGIISDVRSLKDKPESQCKEDVIDLC